MFCINIDLQSLGLMVSGESGSLSNPDGRQDLTLQDIKPLNCKSGGEWQVMLYSQTTKFIHLYSMSTGTIDLIRICICHDSKITGFPILKLH